MRNFVVENVLEEKFQRSFFIIRAALAFISIVSCAARSSISTAFQCCISIRAARRFSHLLEAFLPPGVFVSYPCESPAKLSRLRI